MKKRLLPLAAAVLLAVPATAAANGNAWGAEAQQCIVSSKNLGRALKNGRDAHDLLITPKIWVEYSAHC